MDGPRDQGLSDPEESPLLTGLLGTMTREEGHQCVGCGRQIEERFLLRALDASWHEDCLRCGCCDCRLGEVASTLYTKGDLLLCKRDYLR